MRRKLPNWFFWTAWAGYGLCWTAALLSVMVVEMGREVLDEEVSFSLGKTLHVLAYAVFTVLTAWLPTSRRGRWLCLAFVSLHAALTESVQQFVGRGSSLRDVGLDCAGILLGVILTWPRWQRSDN